MVKTFVSQPSVETSIMRRATQDIRPASGDSGVCNDFGDLEENTCSGQDSSRHSKPDSVLWRFWDAGYERSCHTEGGTVDLGEIS
jgi:hypothetical protein